MLRPGAVVDYEDELVAVIRHDARNLPLEDESVDLIVTSPPYFAQRSYRDDSRNYSTHSERQPGMPGEHYDGQIGSEDTPDEWLDALDECMVEWGRVLKPSGSMWINLGDKYAGSGVRDNKGFNERWGNSPGRKAQEQSNSSQIPDTPWRTKSLMGLPWRFAIRQIDNGWILRANVIWEKPNGLPESVTDRVRRSHEDWFHFVKEPRYFSGVDEIREPHATAPHKPGNLHGTSKAVGPMDRGGHSQWEEESQSKEWANPLGRLPGSVWSIPSEPLLIPEDTREALDLLDHFAAFPQEWPRRIILGWSPTGICTVCGEGRQPVVSKDYEVNHIQNQRRGKIDAAEPDGNTRGINATEGRIVSSTVATIDSYVCACPTPDVPTTPSLVVDPFGGTGTVAGVARTLGRYGISNDLSASYNRLAIWRITQSGHFQKTEQRSWADRQGQLL